MTKLLRFVHWVKEEIYSIIPAIIFFMFAFNLIYFTVGLSLPPGDTRPLTPFLVSLAAFVTGKVLLIANALPIINAFPKKPLIYNIIWKFLIYSVCMFIICFIELVLRLHAKFIHWDLVLQHLKIEFTSPRLWATQLWLSLTFFIFVVSSEFIRVIGKTKILRILFTNTNSPNQS